MLDFASLATDFIPCGRMTARARAVMAARGFSRAVCFATLLQAKAAECHRLLDVVTKLSSELAHASAAVETLSESAGNGPHRASTIPIFHVESSLSAF